MIEIQGKVNTARCYAKSVDKKAQEQIRRMCDYALTEGSTIRIMPDVHAGKGCTIGTTMTVTDKVCPNIVGVDIGCGMYTVNLANAELNLAKIDAACHQIPSGLSVWKNPVEEFPLEELRCFHDLKNRKWLECSLGTLGGGNHFIEVDRAKDGSCYLVIHSGSRNLGKQTAELYQRYAVEQRKGTNDLFEQREKLIQRYRATGRSGEIQTALKALEADYKDRKTGIPEELCWLSGQLLQDYLHDVELCQKFARRNREKIAERVLSITGLKMVEAFHTIHNYIDTKEMILRKGAIAAHEGEKVLIPLNMRDGSVLAVGKGNPEWNYSAPHGAGRIMSRSQAKCQLTLAEYQGAMRGIYTTSVGEDTIDEAPMAYKPLHDILDVIGETVEVVEVMKPIYNFKAPEKEQPWKK